MSFWFLLNRFHNRPRDRRQKIYSQHFRPPMSKATPLTGRRLLSPALCRGVIGLVLLGGLVWSVSEFGYSPPLVEAQAIQVETSESNQPASWQSASFPTENFVAYTSPFGYRQNPYGGRGFHYGLDIAAPMGSYIRAWWGGKVVEVSDDTACGTSVVIQSDDWLHIYCHLQGYIVVEPDRDRWLVDHDGHIQIRQGDRVSSGQRIGRIGMTGRTTGPHLHWGLKYRGSWIDPALVLRAMAQEQR